MKQSIVKFIASSPRRYSTCFGNFYAHHQEPFQTAVAASGFRMNAVVDVFPAVVGWKRLETRPPPHSYENQRLQRQFEEAPDDGHNSARNILSSVYATSNKFYD
jgi:hypothetical protein